MTTALSSRAGSVTAAYRNHTAGSLVISLDLELYWGVTDVISLDQYKETLLRARDTIPAILDIFERYQLHATWATVGFVLHEERSAALRNLPVTKPHYTNQSINNYRHLQHLGSDESSDPYHFGHSLIRTIAAVPHQEIGTHTFSHYYCAEPGQDIQSFRADLAAAVETAKAFGFDTQSIVFPRHQVVEEYLPVCAAFGITAYRGNVPLWPYASRSEQQQNLLLRIIRASDSYANVTGHHTFPASEIGAGTLANVRASHYFRPYSKRLRLFEPLKIRRIVSSLTHAAQHGQVYHLWMHPEDFGNYPTENICSLEQVARHFASLRARYGMQSMTMHEQALATRGESQHTTTRF